MTEIILRVENNRPNRPMAITCMLINPSLTCATTPVPPDPISCAIFRWDLDFNLLGNIVINDDDDDDDLENFKL